MEDQGKHIESENVETLVNSSCCSPHNSGEKDEDPCCEQPLDGSSCCDKNLSKEDNSNSSHCC